MKGSTMAKRDAKDAPLATVGQMVFYTPGKDEPTMTENAAGVPAVVASVQDNGTVTLTVFESSGQVLSRKGVAPPALDDDGKPPLMGPYYMEALKDITPPEPVTPTLTSITPNKAKIGSADLELECAGTGFTNASRVTANGAEVATRFYSDTMVTTILKPSQATKPGTYPITVKNGELETAPQSFTFDPADVVEPTPPETYPQPLPVPPAPTATDKHPEPSKTKR
jgi:hypothetical protein